MFSVTFIGLYRKTGIHRKTPVSEYCFTKAEGLNACKAVVRRSSVKRCSKKFYKISRNTPVPESLFIKVAGLIPGPAVFQRML